MVLPGVPRNKRIKFVEELIRLLIEEGLDGITEQEYNHLNKTIREQMDSVTPEPETVEKDDTDEKPGGC